MPGRQSRWSAYTRNGTRRPADDLSSGLAAFRHAGTYVAKSLLAPGPAISRSKALLSLADEVIE
jgi:hypothetical protein